LDSMFPYYPWKIWKFRYCDIEAWNDLEVQMEFVQWLSDLWNIDHPDKWYSITSKDLHSIHGGRNLYIKHGSSICSIMVDLFPEYAWCPWKFEKVPYGYWENASNIPKFIEWLKTELE